MSWTSLSNNQTISKANLQNAVNTGIFTLTSPISPTSQQGTKDYISTHVSGFNPDYPSYASKSGNELLVKGDIYNTGNVTLSPQYGMYFDSIGGSGTGFPTFTYPVNYLQVANYVNSISSQYLYIYLDGVMYSSPLNLSVYVDNVLIDCQNIYSAGYQALSVLLPSTIAAPSSLFISIDSGNCAVTPPPPNFTNMAFSSSAISRTNGQYQILAQTNTYSNTQGFLYTSNDYGSNWVPRSVYGYWADVATSDDGQYMLAVEYGSGYAWKSSNYGASWYQITNFPAPRSKYGDGTGITPRQQQSFKSAALSNNGAKQCIVTTTTSFSSSLGGNELISVIWISSDYGATWVQSPWQFASRTTGYSGEIFNSVAMDSTGSYIYLAVGEIGGPYGYVLRSTDGGTNFGIANGSQYGANITDISTIADGSTIVATSYNSQTYVYVLSSNNYGVTFNIINHGSPGNTYQDAWFRCCIFKINSSEVDALVSTNYSSMLKYAGNVQSAVPYIYNWPNPITKQFTSLSCSGNGYYMIVATNNGVWKSVNYQTFTQF